MCTMKYVTIYPDIFFTSSDSCFSHLFRLSSFIYSPFLSTLLLSPFLPLSLHISFHFAGFHYYLPQAFSFSVSRWFPQPLARFPISSRSILMELVWWNHSIFALISLLEWSMTMIAVKGESGICDGTVRELKRDPLRYLGGDKLVAEKGNALKWTTWIDRKFRVDGSKNCRGEKLRGTRFIGIKRVWIYSKAVRKFDDLLNQKYDAENRLVCWNESFDGMK